MGGFPTLAGARHPATFFESGVRLQPGSTPSILMDNRSENPVGSVHKGCMSILSHIYAIVRGILRVVGFILATLLGLLLIAFGWTWTERIIWKSGALSRLATAERSDPMVQAELQSMKDPTSESGPWSWAGRCVVRMTNGEYLVYQYWHRQGMVADLFLARGSNGRWYSGNYHFCNDMAVARFNQRPSSITEFASQYGLSVFVGPESAKAR